MKKILGKGFGTELTMGSKVKHNVVSTTGRILRKILPGSKTFHSLVDKYKKDYNTNFMKTVPKPKKPFYEVEWEGGKRELVSFDEISKY